MSQLSRPYQYALGVVVLLAVAWMLVLKPGDEVVESSATPAPAAAPAASAPGVKGLGSAITKAQGAVATSESSADATTAAAGAVEAPAAAATAPGTAATAVGAPTGTAATATTTTSKATPKPTGDPSGPILASLAKGEVAVLLFYERAASDDRAVRRAIRQIPRRHGRVRVFSAPIADVGLYEAITRGVSVLAAPTVLVIGSDRQAHAITGFTDVDEIDQLVGDALKRTRNVSDDGAPSSPDAA